jgi:hypothetical protein
MKKKKDILKGLEQSIKEMIHIREGRIPKKSWNELKDELKKSK